MTPEPTTGLRLPDSKLARATTEFIRDSETDLLFHHSSRVYCWGVLTGERKGLTFDHELLYVASMFHDIGLTARFENSQLRFEVDGANAARDFLRGQGLSEADIEIVWNAIALHTTPGIPEFMRPEIALVQAGAGMDVAGRHETPARQHLRHIQRRRPRLQGSALPPDRHVQRHPRLKLGELSRVGVEPPSRPRRSGLGR